MESTQQSQPNAVNVAQSQPNAANVAHVRPMPVSRAQDTNVDTASSAGSSVKSCAVDFSKVLNIEPIEEESAIYKTVTLNINGVTKDVLVPIPTSKANDVMRVEQGPVSANVTYVLNSDKNADDQSKHLLSDKSDTENIQWIFHELDEQVNDQLGSSADSDGGKIRNMIKELENKVVDEIQSTVTEKSDEARNGPVISSNIIVISPDSPSKTIPDVLVRKSDVDKPRPPVKIIRLDDRITTSVTGGTTIVQQPAAPSIKPKFSLVRDLIKQNKAASKTVRDYQIETHHKSGTVAAKGIQKCKIVNQNSKAPTLNFNMGTGAEIPGFLGSDGKFYVELNTQSLPVQNRNSKPVIPQKTTASKSLLQTNTSTGNANNKYMVINPSQVDHSIPFVPGPKVGLNAPTVSIMKSFTPSSASPVTSISTSSAQPRITFLPQRYSGEFQPSTNINKVTPIASNKKRIVNKTPLDRLLSQAGLRVALNTSTENQILSPQQTGPVAPTIRHLSIPLGDMSKQRGVQSDQSACSSLQLRIDSVYSLLPPNATSQLSSSSEVPAVTSTTASTSTVTTEAEIHCKRQFKGLLDRIVDDVIQNTSGMDVSEIDKSNGSLFETLSPSASNARTTARKSFGRNKAGKKKAVHVKRTEREKPAKDLLKGFVENPFLRVTVENMDLGPRFFSCKASRLQNYLKYRYRLKTRPSKKKKTKKSRLTPEARMKAEGKDKEVDKKPIVRSSMDSNKKVKVAKEGSAKISTSVNTTTKGNSKNPTKTSKMLLITTSGGSYIMPMVPGLTTEGFMEALKQGKIKLPTIDVGKPTQVVAKNTTRPQNVSLIPSSGSSSSSLIGKFGNSSSKLGFEQSNPIYGSNMVSIVKTEPRSPISSTTSVSSDKGAIIRGQANHIPVTLKQPQYVLPGKNNVVIGRLPTGPGQSTSTDELTKSILKRSVVSSSTTLNQSGNTLYVSPMASSKTSPITRLMQHNLEASTSPKRCKLSDGVTGQQINVSLSEDASIVPDKAESDIQSSDESISCVSSSDRIRLLREKLKEQETALEVARKTRENTARILEGMD